MRQPGYKIRLHDIIDGNQFTACPPDKNGGKLRDGSKSDTQPERWKELMTWLYPDQETYDEVLKLHPDYPAQWGMKSWSTIETDLNLNSRPEYTQALLQSALCVKEVLTGYAVALLGPPYGSNGGFDTLKRVADICEGWYSPNVADNKHPAVGNRSAKLTSLKDNEPHALNAYDSSQEQLKWFCYGKGKARAVEQFFRYKINQPRN